MTDRIESCDLALSSADTDALHDADSRWRARFGSASRRELLRRFAAEFESGGLSAALLCARLEQRHVWRHGLAALAAELADERERDAAAVSDAALVTYERKWSKRLARLQRMNPARWAVRELSAEELHAELTLRLLDALRSGEREFSRDERVGREWGLSFLARQRAAGEGGARAARHHRHAFGMGIAHDLDHLLAGGRQHHHQRLLGVGGKGVAIEDLAAGGIVHHAIGHDGLQRANDCIAAGKNGWVRRGKFQSATPGVELARPISPGEP